MKLAFFCESCNAATSSRFCIDCGKKCIEALSSPSPAPSPTTKRIFCIECGVPAPSITTRFCTGCGTALHTPAAEQEARRKLQEETLKAQKAKEEEQKRLLQEEKLKLEAAQKAAEAELKRKQEEEARVLAEKIKAEEERKKQATLAAEKLKAEEDKRKADLLLAGQRKAQTLTSRFCIECGCKSLLPTAKFCVQCGKTFEDLLPPVSSPAISLPPVPTIAPPPLPVSASPRSPPTSAAPRVVAKKPASATLRGPLRPPCRKCNAPTGPRFCTACGEKTDEEIERLRVAGGGAVVVAPLMEVPLAERDRGHTTVLRGELADAQKELKRQAAEAAKNEARANALQAQLEEAQRRSQGDIGKNGTLDIEAEATRALRAMLEEREKELKRMQELLNPGSQPDEPSHTPAAPPMAPDLEFEPFSPPVKSHTLKPGASLHDQLKTATLKKAVIVARPKSNSSADGRLRGATFLGAMQRIQAATSKDIDDDDDGEWDED